MKPYGNLTGKHRWIFDNPTNRSRLMCRNADRASKKKMRQKLKKWQEQDIIQES